MRRAAGRCSKDLFGKTVHAAERRDGHRGRGVRARIDPESGAKITAGFQPIMPTFQGLVSEEGLLELIEYVKSLKALPQDSQGSNAE